MTAPAVALVGHLDSAAAYRAALQALRGPDLPDLDDAGVERLVRRLHPMPVCDLVVHSTLGVHLPATYIDAFLLIDGETFALAAAARKVRAACAEAAASGARIAGLGGFTSIVGERAGLPLKVDRTVFTTGNGLTAAVIAEQVRGIAREGDTIVVVGAAGDVGSGLCRVLAGRGHRLILVGRNPRPLGALAEELGAPAIPWDDAAPRADVVVLVASAARGGIDLGLVPAHARVLDAGHPPNAGRSVVPVASAGRVVHARHPTGGLDAFTRHNCEGDEYHACMVEAEVLALADRPDLVSTGRGNLRPERLQALLDLAAAHGVTPAPLRFSA